MGGNGLRRHKNNSIYSQLTDTYILYTACWYVIALKEYVVGRSFQILLNIHFYKTGDFGITIPTPSTQLICSVVKTCCCQGKYMSKFGMEAKTDAPQ